MAGKRFRRAVKRHRELVWITVVVEASQLEGTLDIAELVIPADWSLTAGFDRATLLGIRGWLSFSQTAVGTATSVSSIMQAIYVTDQAAPANTMDPENAQDYINFDNIFTCGQVGATVLVAQAAFQVNVKSKRKLTSASEVRLASTVAADAATPRYNTAGVLRSLLQLDPPG